MGFREFMPSHAFTTVSGECISLPSSRYETEYASPSTKVCFFVRLCVSKVTYIQAARAVNFYN